MKINGIVVVLLAGLLLAGTLLLLVRSGHEPENSGSVPAAAVPAPERAAEQLPRRVVFDISVHTLAELRVLFDRAEQLADQLADSDASVVLVLHGPEVEFFAAGNYGIYHDIVDQAERLDAGNVVDVRICQSMMEYHGVPRHDIPAFIEQVPDGGAEVKRLLQQDYIYF